MNLENYRSLGWSAFFERQTTPEELNQGILARVVGELRDHYRVAWPAGGVDLLAEITGKLRHEARSRADLPAVGDWVRIDPRPAEGRATIRGILERATRLVRKAVDGSGDEQILATNVDTVLLAMSLNQDLNLRRLERYATLAWESGAQPVVALTKCDLDPSAVDGALAAIERSVPGVAVHALSALRASGLQALVPYLAPGSTIAVLGSSGVGKSTLVNALAGREVMDTGGIREHDDRGKHTTTARHLIALESGALIIDTPGMRELGLVEAEEGLAGTFAEIEAAAAACRFTDCGHGNEPGCAVLAGLGSGEITSERYEAWRKLRRELAFEERKHDKAAMSRHREQWKKIHAQQKQKYKFRRDGGW